MPERACETKLEKPTSAVLEVQNFRHNGGPIQGPPLKPLDTMVL